MEATGLVAAGALAAGADRAPVEAGPAPIAFFSAAFIISSLRKGYCSVSPVELSFNDLLEKVQAGTSDNPFHAIFVAFSQCLPDFLLLLCFTRYCDSSTTALFRRVLGNFPKLGGEADDQYVISPSLQYHLPLHVSAEFGDQHTQSRTLSRNRHSGWVLRSGTAVYHPN